MPELLRLDHLNLRAGTGSVTMALSSGTWLGVVGRSGSGKSRFVDMVAGQEKPHAGTVIRNVPVRRPIENFGRKATPQSLALETSGASTDTATEAMSLAGLWDARSLPAGTLPQSRQMMARLAAVCSGSPSVVALDEELDGLDPWDRELAISLFGWFLGRGGALVAATHLLEIGILGSEIVALADEEVLYAGSMERLLAGADTTLEVESDDGGALKALVAPFQIRIEKLDARRFRLTAKEGQELAVKMLLEGYGTIKVIETRPPTLLEALRSLETRLGRRPIP